jgi:hypothetical protein
MRRDVRDETSDLGVESRIFLKIRSGVMRHVDTTGKIDPPGDVAGAAAIARSSACDQIAPILGRSLIFFFRGKDDLALAEISAP